MLRLIVVILVCIMLPIGVLMLNDAGNFPDTQTFIKRQYLGDNDDGSEAFITLKETK